MVATGGPHDIVENCQNGLLVDVNNPQEMTQAIKTTPGGSGILENLLSKWHRWRGEHYTWEAHTPRNTLNNYATDRANPSDENGFYPAQGDRQNLPMCKNSFSPILTTHSLAMMRRWSLDECAQRIMSNRFRHGDRPPLTLCSGCARRYNISMPDMIISSGTEIYYSADLLPDKGWASHISVGWAGEN